MTSQDQLYPNLNEDRIKFMLDKQKQLQDKRTHYKKIKDKWATANTSVKIISVTLSCMLGGAAILTSAPFSIPIVAAVLSGITIANTGLGNAIVSGFTSQKKAYFRKKHDYVNTYLNKMELFFHKCKEDRQITREEIDEFQKLLEEFEQEKPQVKSKDVKMVEKKAKQYIKNQELQKYFQSVVEGYQKNTN